MGFTREVRTIDKEFLELDKQTQKLISKHERNIKKNYKKALDDLRKQVADLYEKYGDADGKLSLETMNKYARLDNLKKSIQDSLNEVYKANKQEIYTNLKEVYKLNSEGVIKPLEKSISYLPNTKINFDGILKTLDVAKTINEEMAGLNWAERLGKHRTDVIYNVEKTVREGLYNGDTYKTMATRLKDSLEGDVINPTRIVRTEGARVMSTAQTDVLNKVADKVPMKKIWLSANDERTRDTHIAMHKKEVDYEDVFILPDGTEMFAPLQGGNAKNVINCRCVMSIRIAEEVEGKEWKEPTAESEAKEEIKQIEKIEELKKLKESGMSEGDYNQYLNTVNNSSPDIKHLYSKYADDIGSVKETKNGGVYYSETNELEFSYPTAEGRNKYSILAHEYGHYFDYKAKYKNISFSEITKVRDITGIDYVFVDRACMSDEFLASVRKDKKHIKSIITSEKKADLYDNHASSGVQDAIDGLFPKSRIFWGHGEKYYNRYYAEIEYRDKSRGTAGKKTLQQAYKDMGFDAKTLTKTKEIVREYRASSEIWANVVSAEVTGGKSLDYVKEYLPNSYKAMIEIIKGAE